MGESLPRREQQEETHKGMGVLACSGPTNWLNVTSLQGVRVTWWGHKFGPDLAESRMPWWWRTLTLFCLQWRMKEGDIIQF